MAVVAMASSSAYADVDLSGKKLTDLGKIELSKEYKVPNDFTSLYGEVVPTSDGKLMLSYNSFSPQLFALREGDVLMKEITGKLPTGTYVGMYEYEVKANTTYYFYNNFNMGGSFRFYQSEPVEYVSCNPKEGDVYATTGSGSIVVNFNQPVKCTGQNLVINGTTYRDKKPAVSYSGSTIIVNAASAVEHAMKAGSLKKGDSFVIRLSGITGTDGEKYNGNGKLELTFVCAGQSVSKVSEVLPSSMYSYFDPAKEDGLVTLVFDGDLYNGTDQNLKAVAALAWGDIDNDANGEYYYENVPVTIDGKSLSVDLRGKSRIASQLTTSGTNYSNFSLSIRNVRDADGNFVASTGLGTTGSFHYQLPYVELKKSVVAADFEPANGGSLAKVSDLDVYITGVAGIEFDGFKFEYDDETGRSTEIVYLTDCTIDNIDADVKSYLVPIPDEVKGKTNVVVTLNNLRSSDGFDHSYDVKAKYDGFVIMKSNIKNGDEFEKLAADSQITITPNLSKEYPGLYVMYQIVDLNPTKPEKAIVKTLSWLNRQEDGSYMAALPADIVLYNDHTYEIRFEAWATEMDKNYREPSIGTEVICIKGLSKPYVNSDNVLVSIMPSEDTVIGADDNVFTLTFDGLVNIKASEAKVLLGMGVSTSFQSVEPAADSEPWTDPDDGVTVYSSKWVLTMDPEFLKSNLDQKITFSVVATDVTGARLLGNVGEEASSYFLFEYETTGLYNDNYTVWPAKDETVDFVETVILTSEAGINLSYNLGMDTFVVKNDKGEVVATAENVEIDPLGIMDVPNYRVFVKLTNAITAPGVYTLSFPNQFFLIGEQFDSRSAKGAEYTFTVTGNNTDIVPTFDAGKVASLSEVTITFNGATDLSVNQASTRAAGDPIEVLTARGVKTYVDNVKVNGNQAVLTLPEAIDAEGKYGIHVPSGYFSNNGTPILTPLTATYTVAAEQEANITFVPANKSAMVEFKQVEITFKDYNEVGLGSGRATIYNVKDGKSRTLPDAEYGVEFNQMVQKLNSTGATISTDGAYYISFPDGYFLDGNGNSIPGFEYHFTIDKNLGITGIGADENGNYVVYTLGGVLIANGKAEVLNSLESGMYIINGKRIYIAR